MRAAKTTYPVRLPSDLYGDIQRTATRTNLSVADTLRQSIKLGLPKLEESLSADLIRPMSAEERRLAFQVPNPEFDELEHYCARLPKRIPKE